MNILSYRGPGAPGGVSSGLARLWAEHGNSTNKWWFMDSNQVAEKTGTGEESLVIADMDEQLVKGHYRFCNDFLWPVMHDLPQYATLNLADQLQYKKFNLQIARIARMRGGNQTLFVQDYQFALIPKLSSGNSLVFWHIPWPSTVLPAHVAALREIAVGLLHADTIGFHTDEYARNFLQFVHSHIANCQVDYLDNCVYRSEAAPRGEALVSGSPLTIYSNSTTASWLSTPAEPFAVSKVVAHPLGIDMDFWMNLVASRKTEVLDRLQLSGAPFVLSVDRADYTKGVVKRMQAIDIFMERNPEHRERLSFVQVCGRSRPGLSAFDKYWNDCRALAEQVNNKWQTDNWQPIRWLEEPLAPPQLSALYDAAAAMLVNPLRDGLNLTAKEYVACQKETAGVLVLSTRAGVWTELNEHALPVDPYDPGNISSQIQFALRLSPLERERRMRGMKQKVKANSLSTWWQVITESQEQGQIMRTA